MIKVKVKSSMAKSLPVENLLPQNVGSVITYFIIIIIKKGQQCKAGREWYTPYQSEDPRHTIPTYR